MAQTTMFHLDSCPANNSGNSEDCSCDYEQQHYLKLAKISFWLFLFEELGGWLSGSMALMSDGLHVLMDGTENMISVLVSRLVRKGAGEKRVRSVGAKVSAGLLFFIACMIAYEGYERIITPHQVEWYMVVVATIGLGVNLWQRKLHQGALHEHRNITHFWQDLHLLSDIATSVVVIIGGLVMLISGKHYWIDGVLSLGIGCLIMIFTGAKMFGFELHSHEHDHHHEHSHNGHHHHGGK